MVNYEASPPHLVDEIWSDRVLRGEPQEGRLNSLALVIICLAAEVIKISLADIVGQWATYYLLTHEAFSNIMEPSEE